MPINKSGVPSRSTSPAAATALPSDGRTFASPTQLRIVLPVRPESSRARPRNESYSGSPTQQVRDAIVIDVADAGHGEPEARADRAFGGVEPNLRLQMSGEACGGHERDESHAEFGTLDMAGRRGCKSAAHLAARSGLSRSSPSGRRQTRCAPTAADQKSVACMLVNWMFVPSTTPAWKYSLAIETLSAGVNVVSD